MKNFNDTIGNRTRDLPGCSAVPQPTAPPAACPYSEENKWNIQAFITHISLFKELWLNISKEG
jgi:hypothetical protein